ncbi:hypothetical protein H2203_000063 [Taxawa tesnikishii (nom. ined.)]|nr:hypothetical protein H2203_000063 [Dothideales sp. JES 119]
MICSRCLRAAMRETATRKYPSTTSRLPQIRTLASVSPNNINSAAPRQGSPTSSHNPPAATSTSAAQPFSAPLSPSAANQDLPVAKSSPPPQVVKSSVPAGTVLKGLNFTKGKQDPVALEDDQYPAWLWGILAQNEAKEAAAGAAEGDLFSKSKKQRRIAAKALRKQQLLNPEALAPKVPLYEQSIDLPGGDGTLAGALDAGEARAELTRAMRTKRRSAIKEDNFLRAMR